MKKARYFYRITDSGEPIPGTLARLPEIPKTGRWKEVVNDCCPDLLCCEEEIITLLDSDLDTIPEGEIPPDFFIDAYLQINGIAMQSASLGAGADYDTILEELATVYTNFPVVFSFTEDRVLQAVITTNQCDPYTYAVQVEVTTNPG